MSRAGHRSPDTTPQRAPATIETADGALLSCRVWGTGRPVVFVHGWAVSSEVWQYQMAPLSQHLRWIAYDKRGHGRSSDPGRGYDYDTLSDDLAAVLDRLDLHDVVLVGHSMGPAEIVRYLSRFGSARVSSLVLISSALPFMLQTADNPDGIDPSVFEQRRQEWHRDLPKFLTANARSFVTEETSAETVAWLAGLGMRGSLKALLDLNHAITETDLRPDVSRLTLPTLLIHGAQDHSAPIDLTSKRLAAMIPGGELKIYDGAPHGLLITHPEQLTADLAGWVDR